jgi:hypothetical protein
MRITGAKLFRTVKVSRTRNRLVPSAFSLFGAAVLEVQFSNDLTPVGRTFQVANVECM